MRIGIDLGGTKIEGIVLSPAGDILQRERIDSPRDDYDATVGAVCGLAARLEQAAGSPCSVGVGIPGSLSPATGLVRNANSTWLIGKSFDQDLSLALNRPVRVANDADCFALSEAGDGAGADASTVFGIILGTGVGGGIVVNGQLLTGPTGITGEWGHNPLPWPTPQEYPGPVCYCGKHGCIETWISGTGLARDHNAVEGQQIKGGEIARRAATGDTGCAKSMDRYVSRAARAMAGVINILDPEVIVLGGGVSNIDGLSTRIHQQLSAYVFSDTVQTRIVPNLHGDSSGVRGAAWLWPES